MTVSTQLPVLEDLPNPDGARVLLRADLNVPFRDTPGGTTQVADDFRIRALMPTLSWLVDHGADVTVCSHLGRPKGKPVARLSMAPVRSFLESVVPGVKVMENLRFDPGEATNDPTFVDRLVHDQDLYVNDAFGTAHRAHASVVGPPARLPSAAGRLLCREVEVLTQLVDAPARPFIALVGGAKVGDKLGVLKTLSEKVDTLLIGGGMCFTFLDALGHDIGASLVDVDHLAACRRLLQSQRHILLPHDVLALSPGRASGHDGTPSEEVRCFERDLANGWTGLDIGPKTMCGVHGSDRPGCHGAVERSDGKIRRRTFQCRNSKHRHGPGQLSGVHGRGRRGHHSSPAQLRPRRRDRSRLDRRRRHPRTDREG